MEKVTIEAIERNEFGQYKFCNITVSGKKYSGFQNETTDAWNVGEAVEVDLTKYTDKKGVVRDSYKLPTQDSKLATEIELMKTGMKMLQERIKRTELMKTDMKMLQERIKRLEAKSEGSPSKSESEPLPEPPPDGMEEAPF